MASDRIAPIPGRPGYHASDRGIIFSAWQGSGPGARIGSDLRALRPIRSRDGRVQVNLQRKTHRVANLVLAAFVGPRPAGMEACHFPDRDTTNNALSNLRWDTPAANNRDKEFHGTSNHGERNGSARLTADAVREIRRRAAEGQIHAALAAEFGVSTSAVQQAVARLTWKKVD